MLATKVVLLAGVGNIGSHLPAFLARAGVGTLRLVDRDRVEAKNLSAQDYRSHEVGRYKADVLAERLRDQFPDHAIESYPVDLEDLPLGVAVCDLIFGALDSRRARQVLVDEIGWPLGVPVIDGGVGDAGLGRVQVFVPGAESACLECTWGAADYRLAAAEYPCLPGASAAGVPTGAPAYLGSFTASLMASEAVRLLRDGSMKASYEIAYDLEQHHLRRFDLRRAVRCRHDHAITTEAVGAGTTVGEMLSAIEKRFGSRNVTLQTRRGVGRYLSVDALRDKCDDSLASLGLVPGDRLRVCAGGASVWLVV